MSQGSKSSDINKEFLKNYINSGYLVDGGLQVKATKSKSDWFSVADLFYFLESSALNMLLIKYKLLPQTQSFIITKVYDVQLTSAFFNHLVVTDIRFYRYISRRDYPFRNIRNESLNKIKKNLKKPIKFFSYSLKTSATSNTSRWQGTLHAGHLFDFLEKNNTCGHIREIPLNDSNFNYCGVDIEPIRL